ncbi:serine/threonine-protein kinase [Ruficoccus sp. ZRK36]|uniref:serine/threonine protein kinase n=1 Tax=Ruficoccus sp. ZRK36 TaxID=2866311 RepID=UPI001C730533|nr:serine/threonine-protein kinase [Ruficoccus sp. ZRK36]QYY36706.1 serine/threonine protein kinase [Ruficoccus sp. ZRK36]QYY37415.1 serine/threonine protein kinase [Ruficoccus sp. ZRK36]
MDFSDDELKGLIAGDGGAFDPGEIIGNNFEVLEFIKEGADAEVYRVRNLTDGQEYAAKVPKDANAYGQFEHEIELYNILSRRHRSEHLVRVHPSIDHHGCPVFIMEYLHGHTLAERIQSGKALRPREIVKIIKDILSGLSELHRSGIIHCDVNPNNVMITQHGAVLFDLSAGVLSEKVGGRTPRRGTKGYMPPDEYLSYAWDVYSVGVIYYQLMLGDYPAWTRPVGVQDETTKSLTIPEKFGRYLGARPIVEKALQLDPDKRYRNATQMLAQMRNPVHSQRLFEGMNIFKRRHPLSFCVLGFVLVIVVLAGVGGYLWSTGRAEKLRDTYSLNLTHQDHALGWCFLSSEAWDLHKQIQTQQSAMDSQDGAIVAIDEVLLRLKDDGSKQYTLTLEFSSLASGRSEAVEFPLEWSEVQGGYCLDLKDARVVKGITPKTRVLIKLKRHRRLWLDKEYAAPERAFQRLQPTPNGWVSWEDDGTSFSLRVGGSYLSAN